MKNDNFLSDSIMMSSRHQFIYGYNGEDRKKFLKEMENKYPIVLDNDFPIAIYLNEIGLPKIKTEFQLDKIIISSLSREYLDFIISLNLIDRVLNYSNLDNDERITKFIVNINRLFINHNYKKIATLEELKEALLIAKEAYLKNYLQYLKTGEIKAFTDALPISFMHIDFFVKYLKVMLNNSSYFGIIIDHQKTIAANSYKAINSLIGSRINGNMSIKVACEPNDWETYHDLNGVFVESIHDYQDIEFDDSNSQYVKRQKRKYNMFNED